MYVELITDLKRGACDDFFRSQIDRISFLKVTQKKSGDAYVHFVILFAKEKEKAELFKR